MNKREIVRHPLSGEAYILETINGEHRAAGPLHHTDLPLTDEQMEDYLDNQPDAWDDGDWLARELAS